MATQSAVGVWNRALHRIGESELLETEDDDRPSADSCRLYYDDCVREVLEARPWPWAMRQRPLTEISEQVTSYDGDAVQDTFNIPHAFLDSSQVALVLVSSGGTETELEAGDDYTLTPADPAEGQEAEVVLDTAPAVGETLRITVSTSRVGWDYLYSLPADCITPVALLTAGTRLDLLQERQKEEWDKLINDAGDGYVLACNVAEVDAFEYVTSVTNVAAWDATFLNAVVFRLAADLALDVKKDPQLAGQLMAAYGGTLDQAFAQAKNARQHTTKPTSPSVAARG